MNRWLAVADEHEDRVKEAETHRLKGELLLKQNNSNSAEARSCFERAIEIACKHSAKSWELRATMSLARLLVTQGRRDEARTMLADIYRSHQDAACRRTASPDGPAAVESPPPVPCDGARCTPWDMPAGKPPDHDRPIHNI
jgi:ATP/maltotriose-dependent transcriptional regulator MalT